MSKHTQPDPSPDYGPQSSNDPLRKRGRGVIPLTRRAKQMIEEYRGQRNASWNHPAGGVRRNKGEHDDTVE